MSCGSYQITNARHDSQRDILWEKMSGQHFIASPPPPLLEDTCNLCHQIYVWCCERDAHSQANDAISHVRILSPHTQILQRGCVCIRMASASMKLNSKAENNHRVSAETPEGKHTLTDIRSHAEVHSLKSTWLMTIWRRKSSEELSILCDLTVSAW